MMRFKMKKTEVFYLLKLKQDLKWKKLKFFASLNFYKFKMKKILYVEDHRDTAEAVKQMLESEGYETELGFNGKEGIKKAHEKKFDLILLDIMFPDMSGWDIFKTLSSKKYKAKYAFLSVIPVSTERMKELKKAGISDYITKPFTKKDLIERIKKILK